MKLFRPLVLGAIALSFVAVPPPEAAGQNGVVIEAEATDYRDRGRFVQDVEISVLGDRIRFDMSEEDQSVIFRGEDETLLFLDHRRERYSELNRETISEVMESVSTILRELGELAVQLDPDEAEEMERVLEMLDAWEEGSGEPMGPTRGMAFADMREDSRFGSFDCALYEYEEGRESAQICVADASDMDGGTMVVDAFTGFVDFIDGFIAPLRGFQDFAEDEEEWFYALSDLRGFLADGLFPVGAETFDRRGDVDERTEVTSVTRQSLSDSLFEAPSDYRSDGIMNIGGMDRGLFRN